MLFNHKEIEKKYIKDWYSKNVFKTTNNKSKKFYVLDMFPYPSGQGLHVGHPEGYTATDIVARYKRLSGFDVLHPIGWDAFGLPAEQYAIKTGNNPKDFTQENINNFRRQLKSLGFSFDYEKEVDTTDPNYYKITQWIFSQIYNEGLAELKDIEVNWCEGLGTVLANEEVIEDENGNPVSERGSFPVVQRPMKQWVLKITDYADKLLDGLNDLDWPESLKSLQTNWIGKETDENNNVTYKLRDWIFSRQRYWGEPFPIYFDNDNNAYLITDLPVLLPEVQEGISVKPSGTGESPLANFKDWLDIEVDGKKYRRDTNTMPQWAGSSWYYLAYILKNDDGSYTKIDSPEAFDRFKKWLPVDLYVGGQEHAVLHLLYARFWHKVLFDIGIVPTSEPFYKIVNQGMILGEDNNKMSKSKGNIVNPDEIIEKYGADALRLYEMFMGALTDDKPWSDKGIIAIRKWMDRVYKIYDSILVSRDWVGELIQNSRINEMSSDYNLMVKGITEDIDNLKFNTAISKMMVYINSLYKAKEVNLSDLGNFALILSTFAPFIGQALYEMTYPKNDLHKASWPTYNESLIKDEKVTYAVQVNGKLRGTLEVDSIDKENNIKKASEVDNVKKYIADKEIRKVIFISGKIINFII